MLNEHKILFIPFGHSSVLILRFLLNYYLNRFFFFFQMTEVLKAGVLSDEIDLGALAHNAAEQAEEFVRKASY